MDFELSEYQKKILDYFTKNPSSNMLINALAGTGKSSTALMLTEQTTTSDLYVAFNNSIAAEFKTKVKNPKTKVYTLHGIAYSIMNSCLKEAGKGEAKLDHLKIYHLLDNEVKEYDYTKKMFLEDNYVKLLSLCRLTLTDMTSIEKVNGLIKDHNLFDDREFGYSCPSSWELLTVLQNVHSNSIKLFDREGSIDFTDMLYITYQKLKSGEWKTPYWNLYTNIYADECQDLNNLQLSFLPFLKRKNGRFVFIGDKNQAIYAFSGGNSCAFESIPKRFSPCKTFDLPICYRCPEKHLAYVQGKFSIPILCRPNAPKGRLKTIDKGDIINYIKPGDMIIARKNKWLVDVIVQLASNGKKLTIEDKDFCKDVSKFITKHVKNGNVTAIQIGNCAVKLINKMKKESLKDLTLCDNVDTQDTEATQTSVSSQEDIAYFVYKMVQFYLSQEKENTALGLQKYIDSILTTEPSPESIRLCSVHKSKGLEAENVFVLNEGNVCFDFRNSKEQNAQERNLAYVSLTRAKNAMFLVREPKP